MTEFITPELFQFFRDLAANNDKSWFQENKDRYERDVRRPLLRFVEEFSIPLGSISSAFVADARKSGGSLFRIYRDTRFSKDKTPYKTHAGIQFRHEAGKDAHAPGFYLHLEPGEVFAACGIWHPDAPTLTKIRKFLAEHPDQWVSARDDSHFRSHFRLTGSSLKRPPKGFSADHPLIEDLMRKDFIAISSFSEEEVCCGDFIVRFAERCREAVPFVRFLTKASGLNF